MDIPAIEEIVNHAMGQGGDANMKRQATLLIDQLRTAPDRWSVGLKLFFEGRSELCRFFGLSLVRDFLSSAFHPSSPSTALSELVPVYSSIREAVWTWTSRSLMQNVPIPVFILNNLVTVLTLLIKLQFPESWSTAFHDLLDVGRGCVAGLDLAVRVICDLEVEVVMFNENRGKGEVSRNVLIKDTMRGNDNNITRNIVEFLCQSAASIRVSNVELSERCLRCLADMVGWIDISLVACESTLSCIYLALRDPEICSAALACLLELVKKGMESVQKIQMLHAIGLTQVLTLVPIRQQAEAAHDDDEGAEEALGLVLDVFLLELIGCWAKYEDIVFGVTATSGTQTAVGNAKDAFSESQQLKDLAPVMSSLLHSLLPIALKVLSHDDKEGLVASTVVPCLGRLIALFKQQLPRAQQIEANRPTDGSNSCFFLGSDYLHPLLLAVYQQMQFDEDFGYDPSDDEDAAIIEAKKDLRKLFVNCCRVHPEPCLQLISMALSALPQPLSKAPFAPLEAALRLVYSFSECGPQFNTLVNEGTFPALIIAIHKTDISSHPHPQVVLAYFEICVRYIKHADSLSVRQFVTAMVDRRGLRSSNKQVRCRTSYFLFKTAEALEGKASTLLSVVGSIADVILIAPDLSVNEQVISSNTMLSEGAELHLLEAIGLITSSTYCYWEGGAIDSSDNSPEVLLRYEQKQAEAQLQKRQRQQTLEEVIRLISGYIHSILSHPQLIRYSEELGACVAHKLSSLSSLAKGHSYKSRVKHPDTAFDAADSFEKATAAAIATANSLGHVAVVRGKCVIFYHRMIMCMGLRSLDALGRSIFFLLAHCDGKKADSKGEVAICYNSEGSSEEILQLLNQAMLEFQGGAFSLVDTCFSSALKKCWALSAELESNAHVPSSPNNIQSAIAQSATGVNIDEISISKTQVEAPHFEVERVLLQKQSLVFLQHVATQQCDQAFYSERNSVFLTAVFEEEILVGLQGGRGRISKAGGIPLRKAATGALTGLVKAWLTVPTSSTASDGQSAVPLHLSSALWSFLKEKALPTALRACTDGISLDLKDAAAQALLVDIGALLWSLSATSCKQGELRAYFDEALPALGWPPNATAALQAMLTPVSPLGTFKENFKKFIRSAVIS